MNVFILGQRTRKTRKTSTPMRNAVHAVSYGGLEPQEALEKYPVSRRGLANAIKRSAAERAKIAQQAFRRKEALSAAI